MAAWWPTPRWRRARWARVRVTRPRSPRALARKLLPGVHARAARGSGRRPAPSACRHRVGAGARARMRRPPACCCATVVHPQASVRRRAVRGRRFASSPRGAIVAPGRAAWATCVIVNHGAVVDHDVQVGDVHATSRRSWRSAAACASARACWSAPAPACCPACASPTTWWSVPGAVVRGRPRRARRLRRRAARRVR